MTAPIIDPSTRTEPWPGRFERLTISDGGRPRSAELFARFTGTLGDTPPLFHIHGLGGASTNWTDLATALQNVAPSIAIDLPGWGRSDPAPDGRYSIAAASRWAIAAIERLAGGPVHLVGNSMGGLIAIRIAALRPDLVQTLSLISPAVPGLEASMDADPRMAVLAVPVVGEWIQQRFAAGDPMARARMTAEICFADPDVIPPERLREQADEVAVRAGYPWAIPAFTASLRSLLAAHLHRRKDGPWSLARQVSAPTTIIWGQHDRLVPVRRAPKLAAAIASANLHIMPDVGHTAQMEDPLQTARFIGELLNSAAAPSTSASA